MGLSWGGQMLQVFLDSVMAVLLDALKNFGARHGARHA